MGLTSSKVLRKCARKNEVTGQGRNCRVVNVILVRKRSEDMENVPDSVKTEGTYLADFARYRCSVGRRFREIQELPLEPNAISWWEEKQRLVILRRSISFMYYAIESPLFFCPSFSIVSRRKTMEDRKSTRLNSSHSGESRMPSSA